MPTSATTRRSRIPSLPNYLALVSGSTQGVTDDCTSCGPWSPSIGGLLDARGEAWGGYAQGYPSSPLFAKKHMPFLYFKDGAAHVHPLSSSMAASCPRSASSRRTSATTPTTARCRPPMRSSPVAPPLLHVPRTAVFVLFDEGTTSIGGGGRVEASLRAPRSSARGRHALARQPLHRAAHGRVPLRPAAPRRVAERRRR